MRHLNDEGREVMTTLAGYELRNGTLWVKDQWVPVDDEAIRTGLDLFAMEGGATSRPADGPLPPRAVDIILTLDRRMQAGRLAATLSLGRHVA